MGTGEVVVVVTVVRIVSSLPTSPQWAGVRVTSVTIDAEVYSLSKNVHIFNSRHGVPVRPCGPISIRDTSE